MATLLLKNADVLVTMDAARRQIADGALFVRDNFIETVGTTAEVLAAHPLADQTIDARGMLVMPGMVNTHHHLYQTLTRALPGAQDAILFDWLRTLYLVWANLTGDAVYTSAQVGLAELLLSGCTTTTDHLYIYPNDVQIDDEIRAAQELGIRFHPTRGSMSLGKSKGGLPPDEVVEDEDAILADCERVINQYHDAAPGAMVRIALAPCSPFSVTADLMRQSAELARQHGILLHTHVAETLDEEEFCIKKFGCRPVAYMEQLGWLGDDVWFAHCVYLSDAEIAQMAETGTGVAHCPCSNMRLGSGIAPIVELRAAGGKIGIAVDGSASNDSSHLLAEARQALLLQRVTKGADVISAQEVLEMATLGGAQVLGRDDIGALEAGKAADFIGFKLNRLGYAGGLHDPLAALVFCTPQNVDLSVVNGRVVVANGAIVGFDLDSVVRKHNEWARKLRSAV